MTEAESPVRILVFHSIRQQIGMLIGIAGCGYGIWRGGRPERIWGVALLFGWAASPFLINTHDWVDPQWVEAGLDTALFGLILWLAFTTDRYWPMWAAAFLGLLVLMHLTMVIDPRVPPWSYRTAAAIWSYAVLLALVLGTALEVRRPPSARQPARRRWRIWRFGRS